MGATCCKSTQSNNDEVLNSAHFDGENDAASPQLKKQDTSANKRQNFIPAQTFGMGLKQRHSDQSNSKENYEEEKEREREEKAKMMSSKNGASKMSKELSELLERQDSATDRKKILEQQFGSGHKHEEGKQQLQKVESVAKKEMRVGIDVFVRLKKGTISDYYETGEVLGEGAYGKVWKVTHRTTKLNRAMKSIKKSSVLKEEQERLFSEMNILKSLDHPNIVKLYELYEDSKNYYLVTEYCSGGELFDRIKKLNFFSEKKAADVMKQILGAVVYCHTQNIVHRDLKPENLLFVSDKPDANLKVIDFGTSRKFDPTKRMTKRLGTPYYIAPEVLLENYNEKCDVWSCGVILYILLCGYPPFSGRSEEEILQKVKQGKLKFDAEDWEHISKEAKQLITKMLALNPAKRITAEQAFNDQWIQKNSSTNELNQKCMQNLQQFYARSKFKQALLTFIATQILSQLEQEDLQKAFATLDKNGDGILSKEELVQGYLLILNNQEMAEVQVQKVMEVVDINNSGKVDFNEFLIAAINEEKLLSVLKMEQAFKIIDLDGDNFISKQELEIVMGDIEDDIWKQILLECDSDDDGKISLEEFIGLLKSKVL